MSVVTLLSLRVCAGLGFMLLLIGGGITFLNWREDWKLRLTGLIFALAGLVMAIVFDRKLFAYQQSVPFFHELYSVRGLANFGRMLLILGGYGTITKAKFFQTHKSLRILCGAAAVLGVILSVYYSYLMIKLQL